MQTKHQEGQLIIAAVMATGVTPLHQAMAAWERDEGEIALRPPQLEQGHPPEPELNNCSETNQGTPKSKPTQEEKVVETRESVIEPVCQASEVQGSNWPKKGEREDASLIDQLKRLTGLTSLTNLPGFGILLAILCVLWGQVWFWYFVFSKIYLKAGAVVVKKMTLNPFILLLWRDLLRLTTQVTRSLQSL